MKRTSKILFLLSLLLLTGLLLACSAGDPAASTDPTALPYSGDPDTELQVRAAQMAEQGDPDAGREVFAKYCQVCHAADEAVQIIGPSLLDAGDRYQFGYILASIENPHEVQAEGVYELEMPEDLVTRLSPQELNDVVAFIGTLRK